MARPKILFADPRADYCAFYGLNVYTYTNCEVISKHKLEDVLEATRSEKPSLIVVNPDISDKGDAAVMFYNELSSLFPDPNIIVLGNTSLRVPNLVQTELDCSLKGMIQLVAKELGITAAEMASIKFDEYFNIPVWMLLPNWKVNNTFYIKKEGEAPAVFLKNGDFFSEKELQLLRELDVSSIFINSKERLQFVSSFSKEVINALKNPAIDIEKRATHTANGYELARAQVLKIGISKETVELVDVSLGSMKSIVKGVPKLEELLESLMKDQTSFRYRHTVLTTFIGSHILKELEWPTKEDFDKFAFAAFFHDILLPHDSFAQFQSDKEVDGSKKLSPVEKKLIKNHAMLGAKLVSNFAQVPEGVATIIHQHHGSKKGNTLSKMAKGLDPLAIVFILAEEWAKFVLEFEAKTEKIDKKKVIGYLTTKYSLPQFTKVIPVLHSLTI